MWQGFKSAASPFFPQPLWDGCEGNTLLATGVNPAVTLNAGAHTLTLAVTDPSGESSSDTVVVTVEPMGFDGFLNTAATGMSQGTWKVLATLSDGSRHEAWFTIK